MFIKWSRGQCRSFHCKYLTPSFQDILFLHFQENLESTISCFANKTKSGPFFASSADTAKQYIKNCTEKLIEKTEICLPDEEKHWPKFCLEVAQNVIDFFFANKNTISECERSGFVNF
jgi:hypothetical protein